MFYSYLEVCESHLLVCKRKCNYIEPDMRYVNNAISIQKFSLYSSNKYNVDKYNQITGLKSDAFVYLFMFYYNGSKLFRIQDPLNIEEIIRDPFLYTAILKYFFVLEHWWSI